MTDAPPIAVAAPVFLRETELAQRWNKSTRTLQRWRARGCGPAYVVLRRGVRYRYDDVLTFEAQMRRAGGAAE